MSGVDLHDLRMQEFPHNVRLALKKLEWCLQSPRSTHFASLQQRIIEEFIFCPHNNKHNASAGARMLSQSVNELIVIRLLAEHIAAVVNPTIRNALLIIIFHPTSIEAYHPSTASQQQFNPYTKITPNQPNIPYGKNSLIGNPYARPGGNSYNTNQNMNNPYLNNHYNAYSQGNTGNFNPNNGNNGSNYYNNNKNAGVNTEARIAYRLNILSALTSLAMATKNVQVLEAVAVWMQQVCCLSGWSGQVSKRLIAEYCSSTSTSVTSTSTTTLEGKVTTGHYILDSLPMMTPLFTANLITSWAQLYARLGIHPQHSHQQYPHQHPHHDVTASGMCLRPPVFLLRLVVSWLRSSSQLLLTPLTTPTPVPPLGMPPTTPTLALAPLLRLCVEAPLFLYSATTHNSHKREGFTMTVKSEPLSDIASTDDIHTTSPYQAADDIRSTSFNTTTDNVDDVFGKKNRIKEESAATVSSADAVLQDEAELYCALHLSLLRLMQGASSLPPPQPLGPMGAPQQHRQVLASKHVTFIVEGLINRMESTFSTTPNSAQRSDSGGGGFSSPSSGTVVGETSCDEVKTEAVNRLSQALLVALRTECIFGPQTEMWAALRRLPRYGRLSQMLLSCQPA